MRTSSMLVFSLVNALTGAYLGLSLIKKDSSHQGFDYIITRLAGFAADILQGCVVELKLEYQLQYSKARFEFMVAAISLVTRVA